ncbi:MAG: D-arabinono-1,4-lactone oxidase [Paracoccus sp. (in: a-proteobacteria)]|nr:D-arabinono-1,4-lactone oxidase [Paracoccus sp. (in: a-proteobacteria)]
MESWTNWSGLVTAHMDGRVSVKDEAQLAGLIRSAQGPIKVVGSGHSFTPLCATDGTQLLLEGFCDVVADGPGTVRAGAGVTLNALARQLHAQGHALANMGDIDAQRLGGLLATATHGTGAGFRTLSAELRGMVLYDGRGQRRELSQDRDGPLFRAMAVSLGTGGIITEFRLATVAPYRLTRHRSVVRLDEIIADLPRLLRAARNVEYYYIPHSGLALCLTSQLDPAAPDRLPADGGDQDGLRRLRMMARLMRRAPRLRRYMLGRLASLLPAETISGDWHRVYPTDREGLRFNETEYHLPVEAAPAALSEVIRVIERHFPEVYFPMEIRLTAADDLPLSPFYGRDCVSIAVHHEAGRDFAPLLAAVEPIFLRHEGRPHWGKLHSLTAPDLRPLYPLWDEAIEARRELDPDGRFLTPYLRRLLGL